ncbi:hypothetical protein [Streptomyces sp. C184]|uniref:hypothetical protein n=1 Tax=Streptomyces sp. C184 TaxID=3237121 RepID=UPI0034C5CDAF
MSSLMALFDPFGAVPGSSLNWSQHAALQSGRTPSVAVQVNAPMISTDRIESELHTVGANVEQVVGAIDSLESELGLELGAQAQLLAQQIDLLTDIAQTLHTPAHTRAAERLADSTELLRHKRYERALTTAQQAIEGDPNNDAAFMVAGWACRGLERAGDARRFFREAAQATDPAPSGDFDAIARHVHAALLAARLTFALEGPQAALSELVTLTPDRSPAKVAAAIRFDRSIYLAASDDVDSAIENFQKATGEDPRFCLMALTDPVIAANEPVYAEVIQELHRRKELINAVREMLRPGEDLLQDLRAELRRHDLIGEPQLKPWLSHRVADLLTPSSQYRREVLERDFQQMGSPHLRNEYLTCGADAIAKYFRGFKAQADPLIQREISREEVLNDAVARSLRHRGTKQLHRGRIKAVLGQHGILTIFAYEFWRLEPDLDGRMIVTTLEPTDELVGRYRDAPQ